MFKPLTSHQTKHTALKFVDAGSLLFRDHFSSLCFSLLRHYSRRLLCSSIRVNIQYPSPLIEPSHACPHFVRKTFTTVLLDCLYHPWPFTTVALLCFAHIIYNCHAEYLKGFDSSHASLSVLKGNFRFQFCHLCFIYYCLESADDKSTVISCAGSA